MRKTARLPVLYLLFYCKIRKRCSRKYITKKEFRKFITEPIGVQRKHFGLIIDDFKRYGLFEKTKGNNITLKNSSDNARLFENLIKLTKRGLI